MIDLSMTLKSRVAPTLNIESQNGRGKGGVSDKKNSKRKVSSVGGVSVSASGLPGGKKKKKKLNPLRPIYKLFRLNKRLRAGLEVRCFVPFALFFSICVRDVKTPKFFGPARPVVHFSGPARPVIKFFILGPFEPVWARLGQRKYFKLNVL